MIRHIVLIKFTSGTTEEMIGDIWTELNAIKDKVPGLLSINSGRSESPEKIERGYLHGFVADFADLTALEVYQAHPAHVRLSARLLASAVGGIDGILVFDLLIDSASTS